MQRSDSSDEEDEPVRVQSRRPQYRRSSIDDDRGEGPSRPYGARPASDDDGDDYDLPDPGRARFERECIHDQL